jgi:hypothetical protein
MPFTNTNWDAGAVESGQDAAAFCECCLLDLNAAGAGKIKGPCKLPVKATPGGPYNLSAMAAAAAVLAGGRGGVDAPPEKKRAAARKLVSLYREAQREPPPALLRAAGMRAASS